MRLVKDEEAMMWGLCGYDDMRTCAGYLLSNPEEEFNYIIKCKESNSSAFICF